MTKHILTTILFMLGLLTSSAYGVSHKASVSLAPLIRNSSISQISILNTNDNIYSVNIENWKVDGTVFGVSVDVAYEATFKNNFFLRVATGIESTGQLYWPIDIGGGVKVNIANIMKLSVGVYLATVQMSGKLGIVTNTSQTVDLNPATEIPYYIGMFGFKGRIMLEIPINKKYTLSPFISYSAYPHAAHNLDSASNGEFFINNLAQGLRLDGIQIGAEFGILF